MAFQIENSVLVGYTDDGQKEITVPEGVTEIGAGVFQWSGLSHITLPESVNRIGQGAFSGCLLLEHISIPEAVTRIPEQAFHLCASLTTIDLPESITEIGEGAFKSCLYLSALRLPPYITTIAPNTFDSCMNLQRMEIPEGVAEIGEGAFRECTKLRTVVIPESVTRIGNDAFTQCDADLLLMTQEPIYFPYLKNQSAAERQTLLDFICEKSVTGREKLFKRMKQLRQKAAVVLYLLDRERNETVREYLHSRVRHLMEFWIQENDAASIGRFLSYGYVTSQHIDGLVEYAIACRSMESQSILMHYKNEIGYTAPEEYFRL